MTDVFIVAVEASGDSLGAALIEDLQQEERSISVGGIGGNKMSDIGISSDFDISPLAILGLFEGVKAYPIVRKRVREAVQIIMANKPRSVVLIDSWGFMLRVAWGLRKAGYAGKIIKYVAPQVWAMRAGRAKTLANAVDHLLSIQLMDAPYFEPHGLPVTYVGNPMFDQDYRSGSGAELRDELGIKENAPVLAVMFGSRRSEIERLSEPFAEALELLTAEFPELIVVSPVSSAITDEVDTAVRSDPRLQPVRLLPEGAKFDIFAAADAALACSGTVTTQLASAGVPTVVAYKLHPLTFHIAKHLFRPNYISLVNIAADKLLMPEFIQHDCTGEKLAGAIAPNLRDADFNKSARDALTAQTDAMKGEGGRASLKAARAVIDIIGR